MDWSGLAGLEVDADGAEGLGAAGLRGALENLGLPGDGEVDETGFFYHGFQLCFQQSAGNSSGP